MDEHHRAVGSNPTSSVSPLNSEKCAYTQLTRIYSHICLESARLNKTRISPWCKFGLPCRSDKCELEKLDHITSTFLSFKLLGL